MRLHVNSSALLLLSIVGGTLAMMPAHPSAQSGGHDYFNALVARSDHWKSASLRDPVQLDYPRAGGMAAANSGGLWVTYDPSGDLDPQRQDAAKVVVPPFSVLRDVLVTSIGPADRFLQLANSSGDVTKVSTAFNSRGRQVLVGDEVMVATAWPAPCPATNPNCNPLDRTTGVLHVTRGQGGTTATSHGAYAEQLMVATNSLQNQVRVPLGTSNGNTYLFTWDTYHTDSYIKPGISNHKAFQFASNSLWLEGQTRFDGGGAGGAPCFDANAHIASIEMRGYPADGLGGSADWAASGGNRMGPGTTSAIPILPRRGVFCQSAGRWTRWWVLIEQRANDYDYMSFWVADEKTDAVQLYHRTPLSVEADSKPLPDSIVEWWIEFNSSDDALVGTRANDRRDLVAYVKNFVALINPPDDIAPFLVRPIPGAPLPPADARPSAPRNLRIGN